MLIYKKKFLCVLLISSIVISAAGDSAIATVKEVKQVKEDTTAQPTPAANTSTTSTAPSPGVNVTDTTAAITTTTAPPLPATAAKLVRYRRHPPITVIKHVVRSSKRTKPRRRLKRPKINYGPPNMFSYGEPISYYKPQSHPVAPSYSLDEFQHLNLEATDFDLPPSSYETQSMDLDFYGEHSDAQYEAPKTHGDEYSSFNLEPEYTAYSPPSKVETYTPRVPHQKYGVPKEYEYTSDYSGSHGSGSTSQSIGSNSYLPSVVTDYRPSVPQGPSVGDSYPSSYGSTSSTYEAPKSKYHPSMSYNPPNPSAKYSVPAVQNFDSYSPPKPKPGYQAPVGPPESPPDGYEAQKLPSPAYDLDSSHHRFAEPPAPAPPDFDVSYSPSYEINIPPSNNYNPPTHGYQSPGNEYQTRDNSYQAPDNSYQAPDNSYQAPENTYQPGTGDHYQPPDDNYQPPGNFAEPPQEPPPRPPQPPHHPEQSAPDNRGHPAAEVPSPVPPPSNPSFHYPVEDYRPPAEELPLNPYHKQPAYDFPKSSYEVPIYDPIPFDASNNNGEQEFYPPHSIDSPHHSHSQEGAPVPPPHESSNVDTHSSGSSKSTSTTRRTRKRKRVRGSSTTSPSTHKHILDAPELEKAFEAEKRHRNQGNADADVNESNQVEEKQKYRNFVTTSSPSTLNDSDSPVSNLWNPMRIQTSSSHLPLSTKTTASRPTEKPSLPTTSLRLRPPFKLRPRPITIITTTRAPSPPPPPTSSTLRPSKISNNRENLEKVSIISIEKSQSKSYYDGTIAPPSSLTVTNLSRGHGYGHGHVNVNVNAFKGSTHQPQPLDGGGSQTVRTTPKRTTKSVFNTTYFKSPQNDREATLFAGHVWSQHLPKNHRPY